jgi:type IV secretion system protein VirD4
MSETRDTVEKLKQELQKVQAASERQGSDGAAASTTTIAGSEGPMPQAEAPVSGRARGRAARAAAGGGGAAQVSFDPAGLGLKEADKDELAVAVQTTRAIIAEYA